MTLSSHDSHVFALDLDFGRLAARCCGSRCLLLPPGVCGFGGEGLGESDNSESKQHSVAMLPWPLFGPPSGTPFTFGL